MTNFLHQSHVAALVLGVAVIVLALSGCVTQPEPPPVPQAAPVGFDALEREYRDAASRGESVYRINREESMVRILAFRAGPLARLGHDHAVISHQISGFARVLAGNAMQADLHLDVMELIVDDPQARAAAGMESEPTAEDIKGTRRNMLSSLDADRYPTVLLHVAVPSLDFPATGADVIATVELTLHGVTRPLAVPVHVVTDGGGFRVTGAFDVRQTDFGITPFSVFGGALSVRDELELTFELVFTEF